MRQRTFAIGLVALLGVGLGWAAWATDPTTILLGVPRHAGYTCTSTSAGFWQDTDDDSIHFCAGSTDFNLSTLVGTGGIGATQLATNAVEEAEMASNVVLVEFCGQLIMATPLPTASGLATYLGPAAFGGTNNPGGTACDALDNVTVATADAPVFVNEAAKVTGLYCTMGTGNAIATDCNITATLLDDTAVTTPSVTCTIASEETDCKSTTTTTKPKRGG